MKGKIFVDSNVLICLFSETEPEKQKQCENIIQKFNDKNQLVWSTQVVQELSNNLIKKSIDPSMIKRAIAFFSGLELIINDLSIIEKAMDIHRMNKLSFWDSLIISSALSSKCTYILTEDFPHGQKIETTEIVNPFLL